MLSFPPMPTDEIHFLKFSKEELMDIYQSLLVRWFIGDEIKDNKEKTKVMRRIENLLKAEDIADCDRVMEDVLLQYYRHIFYTKGRFQHDYEEDLGV